jgi:hypothetical protein
MNQPFKFGEVACDAICILEMREDVDKKRLVSLIKVLSPLVETELLKERLDVELLEQCEIVDASSFNRKIIKFKTTAFYRQQRFNLLREVSEGAALLLALVNPNSSWPLTPFLSFSRPQQPHQPFLVDLLDKLERTMGKYEIDCLRLQDLAIDQFCSYPEYFHIWIAITARLDLGPFKLSCLLNIRLRELNEFKSSLAFAIACFAFKGFVSISQIDVSTASGDLDIPLIGALIASFASIGDCASVISLLNQHPAAFDSIPAVRPAICRLIESLVEPIYSQ